jgi:hypothetical protein
MVGSYGYIAAGLTALVTLGCSSGSGRSGAEASAPIVVTDERAAALSAALGERVISDDVGVVASLAAAPDKVHQALVVAYTDLGVPATIVNPSDGLVAAIDRLALRRLGQTALSRYLSCGETITGSRADQDRIVLSVVSRAKPDGPGRTRVETRVVAMATDVSGTATRIPCTTTGQLEARLHSAAKAKLT